MPIIGPRIGPLRRHEREYDASVRREVLSPIVNSLERRLTAAVAWTNVESELIYRASLEADQWAGLDTTATRLSEQHNQRVGRWHTQRFQSAMRRYLGVRVNFLDDEAIGPVMRQRIVQNVDLIKSIPRRYHQALIHDMTRLQATTSFDEQALHRMLTKGYRTVGNQTKLITRDQTSKLVGQLNHARQTEVGISEYIWYTSQDDRVRETHEALSGTRQRWDDPPSGVGNPGDDYACRCIARAVVPGYNPVRTEGPTSFI